jgi:hypothetical protein
MELPKLGIMDTYLFKPKWSERNTGKAHLKEECPQKDILMLEDHDGVRKKYENSTSRKKMRKNDLVASPALRGKDSRRKNYGLLKIPKRNPENTEDR